MNITKDSSSSLSYLKNLTTSIHPPLCQIKQKCQFCVRLNETIRSICCVPTQPHSATKLQELAIQRIEILEAISIACKAVDRDNADAAGSPVAKVSAQTGYHCCLKYQPTHPLWLVWPTQIKTFGNSTWRH